MEKAHTNLFAIIMPTATMKLNVNATTGPQNRCCWRLAPSEVRSSLKRELLSSSKARPDDFKYEKFKINKSSNEQCILFFVEHSFRTHSKDPQYGQLFVG